MQEYIFAELSDTTLEGLLEFIYTGTTALLATEVETLFQAAQQFEIGSLIVACGKRMVAGLNLHNAASLLLYADKLGATQLRQEALHFLRENIAHISGEAIGQLHSYKAELLAELYAKQ